MTEGFQFDWDRGARIGLHEAVLCAGKSVEQIERIIQSALDRNHSFLLTRLDHQVFGSLPAEIRAQLDYDAISRTAFLAPFERETVSGRVAIVSAGTSDLPVAQEVARTLLFYGEKAEVIADVGVAGLWRILEHADSLNDYRVVIVVAGMDGALVSVVGGLTKATVIAVPTSTGYGVARNGETALASALTSCAPGIVVVNIDNGFGAACAALRITGCQGNRHESRIELRSRR